jgi:RecA-family ATPase
MNAKQGQTPEKASGSSESLFEQVDWFVLEPRKKRWLVDGLLLRKGSSLLVGKPKAGKSTVAKNIAVAVLKGQNIFGRSVESTGQPGRVVYLQLEGKDDVAGTAEQFRALGVTAEEAKRLLVFQRGVQKGKMEERVIELAELLRKFPADLVVVDTLRLFTGKAVKDSNSYDDTVEAMDNVEPVLRKSGWQGHLSAVHHGRKDDEKKNQMLDSVLGSSGLAASVNTVILISHPDDDSPFRPSIFHYQDRPQRASVCRAGCGPPKAIGFSSA